MRTCLQLEKAFKEELPPAFQHDDVRYPESLVRHFLQEFTQAGDVVFDPFAGYGTTLIVAEAMGRIPFGLELDEAKVNYVRARLRQPQNLIHGDTRRLLAYDLPEFDFSLTSPPYMSRDDEEDPFTNYTAKGRGYRAYLRDIRSIYGQLRQGMKRGGTVVIEASNLKIEGTLTTLAWDIAREVSEVLRFEGEVVVGWDKAYGYGYDHSYCLVFSAL